MGVPGLFLALLLATASAQYYGGYESYDAAYYYDLFHQDECEMNVPEGLSVPTMCLMYYFVNDCQELGYDPHILVQYRECLEEILDEEHHSYVDDVWDSAWGPGGNMAYEACSAMGYDISTLNHYAVCMEHIFGIGYAAVNASVLGVEIVEDVPELVSDWYYYYYHHYYYYNWNKVELSLPDDPIARMNALLHAMALEYMPFYNACPDHGDYMCSNGECIPDYWECDGWADCVDGTDELLCSFDWEDEWYGCYIEDWEWCDGWQDCAYDEQEYCHYYWHNDYYWYTGDWHYNDWYYNDWHVQHGDWYYNDWHHGDWSYNDWYYDDWYNNDYWYNDYNWNNHNPWHDDLEFYCNQYYWHNK